MDKNHPAMFIAEIIGSCLGLFLRWLSIGFGLGVGIYLALKILGVL